MELVCRNSYDQISNDSDDMEIKMLDRRNWSYSQAKQQQLLQLQLDYSAADVDNRLENTTVLQKTSHPHFAILRDISVLTEHVALDIRNDGIILCGASLRITITRTWSSTCTFWG